MQKARTQFTPPTTENAVVQQKGDSVHSTQLPSGLGAQPKEPTMRNPKLNRAQRRRRISELADPLDRIARNDLNFFTWFPHREYRVRVADPAEIELAELLGKDMSLPSGKQHYMAIQGGAPLGCLRLPVAGPPHARPGLFDEELAQAIFEEIRIEEPFVPEELLLESINARNIKARK